MLLFHVQKLQEEGGLGVIYTYWYIGLGMLVEENSQYVDMSDTAGRGRKRERRNGSRTRHGRHDLYSKCVNGRGYWK